MSHGRDRPECGVGAADQAVGGGLVLASVGDVGGAVFPGQKPEDVLLVADVIDRYTDIGAYPSRQVARRVLRALAEAGSRRG